MSMVTFGRGGMASLVPNNDKFHKRIRNIIPDMAHKPVFLCLCHYRFPPTALELKTPIICDFDGLVIEEANIHKAVLFLEHFVGCGQNIDLTEVMLSSQGLF